MDAPATSPAAVGSLPPGPPLPRWLQTAGFVLAPARFLSGAHRRYGQAVTFRTLFDSGFVVVFDPELVKQVFRAPPEQLRAGEANVVLEPVVGTRSVLLLDGAEHVRQRRLLLGPFHGERMRAYEQTIIAAADRQIDSWPVGERFALRPSMQALTLDVIMRAVFGLAEADRVRALERRVRTMLDPMGSRMDLLVVVLSGARLGGGASRRFARSREAVDELIYAEIAARRGASDLEQREDILSMLLLARDEDGEPMSDEELRDELVTLLVAGHETTATALAWAFELLLRNPGTLARLRSSLPGDGAYLDAVIKETLRARPVISGVGRVVRERPFELGDHVIPIGTEINPSIAVIHRRADRFPQAGSFRPERFLTGSAGDGDGDGADGSARGPDSYSWIPFGGGTRRCLGASFATFEMRTVIRRVLERTELLPSGRPDRGVREGITFVPRHGTRAVQPAPPRAAVPEHSLESSEQPESSELSGRSGLEDESRPVGV